jgi:uncharacterized membrane protein YqjE
MPDTPPGEEESPSIIRRFLQTLHDTARNRLELFLVELKEESLRQFQIQVLIAVALICAWMVLLIVTLILVVVFWDTHRLLVLGLLAAAYAVGAAVAWRKVNALLRDWRPFSATLDEFEKDSACFKKPN